ncbi:MAG: nuclear transport factor 2 family protein [Bryobacteraceae bacterium]|jgi:ketosteroid isomerase-like protein
MPQDDTQTVRSFYHAFARRDAQLLTELLDPQIEWTSAENFLYADQSPYVGVDAVLKLLFGRLLVDWDDFAMSPGEILGGGEIVIARGRFRGTFKANGAPINAQFAQVFQFKDGKVAKCQMYTDTAQFKETISRIRSVSA